MKVDKVKNRGFTLVEVLGVFTILAIILLISLPAVTKTLQNNQINEYDAFKVSVESAAETYFETYRAHFQSSMSATGNTMSISIATLKSEGLITDVPKKPNGSTITDTMVVKATVQSDGTIKYEFQG